MNVYETVQAAIIKARMELGRSNVSGRVVVELDPREWNHFRHDVGQRYKELRYDPIPEPMPERHEYALHGGIVRLRP